MKPHGHTRRQLLCAGVGILGTKAFPTRLLGQESAALAYASRNGLLEAIIEARYDWVEIAGRFAHLFSFNGQVPGPRLEVRPGDTVRLHFVNTLPEPTNLHFHGLHAPPTGSADNAFLEIPPQETFTYEFTLPLKHAAGTFWYHPHLHGRAARQVFRGLAGLLIVRGELDQIPEVAAASEQFLVLKDFARDATDEVPEPNMMERMLGREGPVVTVNGIANPTLSIASGGIMRLRILNASASRYYRLVLEEHPLYLIGSDGGGIAQPVATQEVLLAPGERIDALVKTDRPASAYRLLNLPYQRDRMGMMGTGALTPAPQVLATVIYEGQAQQSLGLPTTLVTVDPLPDSGLPARRFVLSGGGMPGRGTSFLINGRVFNHDRVDTSVHLGSVEDWEIVNASVMDHPFHLHTNPFQLLDAAGNPVLAWKDVVNVPAGQRRRLRVRFADYTGKSVYHCHILDHEDLGMMGVVEAVA